VLEHLVFGYPFFIIGTYLRIILNLYSIIRRYEPIIHYRLFHPYDKVNTVVYSCAIEVYLHALATTEIDGPVTLTSTFDG